jgi:hypothetical protein
MMLFFAEPQLFLELRAVYCALAGIYNIHLCDVHCDGKRNFVVIAMLLFAESQLSWNSVIAVNVHHIPIPCFSRTFFLLTSAVGLLGLVDCLHACNLLKF